MRKLYLPLLVFLAACGQGPIQVSYKPELPALPSIWQEIIGEAHWRLEWIDQNGKWSVWEGKEGFPDLSPIQEWTTPVLAWPFWPEAGLFPGQMSPAGALFPWDVRDNRLVISWKAGIDAFFWKELSDKNELLKSSGTPRLPWLFDWPRFRELMKSENIPAEVRLDPWLADWQEIARKTTESGFDQRRIRAAARTVLSVFPCQDNLWTGYSSFGKPIEVSANGTLVLNVQELPETWVSGSGLLRCQKDAWIFIPREVRLE